MALQLNGEIVVVAGSGNPSEITHYVPNGTLDAVFGAAGVASLAFPSATQVVARSNGNILVTSGPAWAEPSGSH
jgi:hypothetical protein